MPPIETLTTPAGLALQAPAPDGRDAPAPAGPAPRDAARARRLAAPDAGAVWPRADVDRVLQHRGHGAIIFRRDEQHPVIALDRVAETHPGFGRAGSFEILVVERQ